MKATSPAAIKLGFLFAIGSAALFAIRPIFVKLVYAQGVDSTTLITLRMVFSVPIYLVLLIYFLRNKRQKISLSKSHIMKIFAIGLIGYYVASFLDLLGLQYVTAQLGRMILYTYPTFVVIFGAIFFNKEISLRTVLALVLTYLGIAAIFGHDLNAFGKDVVTGSLLITASAIVFSFYLLFSKTLMAETGSRIFTCLAFIGASLGIFTHYLITHASNPAPVTNTALTLILCIAVFCTVIPSFFTTAAVQRIGADRTGIIAMIGPGFTSVFAVAILGESFTIYHLLGIALTIAGVAILSRK